MNDPGDHYQQKKEIGQRFKQFRELPGKSKKELELKQQQPVRQETNADEDFMISRPINSIYYFIDCLYILKLKDKYRLVALQRCKVLLDKYYPTERGCLFFYFFIIRENPCNLWAFFPAPLPMLQTARGKSHRAWRLAHSVNFFIRFALCALRFAHTSLQKLLIIKAQMITATDLHKTNT